MGRSATEDTGMGTSPQPPLTPSPSLPSLTVFRSCSQALGAGEPGPLNASWKIYPSPEKRFFLPPPQLSAPPQSEEEEGTGDK